MGQTKTAMHDEGSTSNPLDEEIDQLAMVIAKLLRRFLNIEPTAAQPLEQSPPKSNGEITPGLLTVEETSRWLGLTTNYVYRIVARKKLPSVKIGRSVRIKSEDLLAWIEARRRH